MFGLPELGSIPIGQAAGGGAAGIRKGGALAPPFYSISSITGQWSLPMTSLQISAFLMRGRSRSDTIK